MAQSWQSYVQAAQQLGFSKCTIINRQNYQTLAYSSATDIATAWKDEKTGNTVN